MNNIEYGKHVVVQCFFCGSLFHPGEGIEDLSHEIYNNWDVGIVGYETDINVYVCDGCHDDPDIFNRERFIHIAKKEHRVVDKVANVAMNMADIPDRPVVNQISLVRVWSEEGAEYTWRAGKWFGDRSDWVLVPESEYTLNQVEMAKIFRKYTTARNPGDILDDIFTKLSEKEQDEWLDFMTESPEEEYNRRRIVRNAIRNWRKRHPDAYKKEYARFVERMKKDPEVRERYNRRYRNRHKKVRAQWAFKVMFGEGPSEPLDYYAGHRALCEFCHKPYYCKPLEGCRSEKHAQKYDHKLVNERNKRREHRE